MKADPPWWKVIGIDIGIRPLHWTIDIGTATHSVYGHIGPFIFWLGF